MSWFGKVTILSFMVVVAFSPGCMPLVEDQKTGGKAILGQEERGFVCLILVDMSGSYESLMTDGGKAYELVSGVLNKYFQHRVASGTNDRVILGQLSGTKNAMLFDGTPMEMRQKFSSPKSFRDWLKQNSNSSASRIHDGVREGIRYVMDQPGVSEGKARTAVIVASDMEDNASDESGGEGRKSINFLLGALESYGRTGGNIALVYVEPRQCEQWRSNLRSRFRPGHFVVESAIVQKIPIPDFSDD